MFSSGFRSCRPTAARCLTLLATSLLALFFCNATAQTESAHTATVLSVTHETEKNRTSPEVCRQTVLTSQQVAQQQEDDKTWIEKNWVATIGGSAGIVVGVPMASAIATQAANYTTSFAAASLVIPTILIAGSIGFFVTQLFVPSNPLLATPKPGSLVAEQKFFVQTVCAPGPPSYISAPNYRITYRFNGNVQTALVKYDPGERVKVNQQGRPLNEVKPASASPTR
jgi:uncharacterized protein YcfJ